MDAKKYGFGTDPAEQIARIVLSQNKLADIDIYETYRVISFLRQIVEHSGF